MFPEDCDVIVMSRKVPEIKQSVYYSVTSPINFDRKFNQLKYLIIFCYKGRAHTQKKCNDKQKKCEEEEMIVFKLASITEQGWILFEVKFRQKIKY